ncbi:MAG TPA: ribonuclease HII [Candidatus Eisenbacteria bacterium]|nr:ribonuclease HII [Candidatus Eisenbacteria bacterium]
MSRSRLARFDDGYREQWGELVAGVDEAGRGPLAGPVVAGCVVLPADARGLRGVRDSKEMTAEEREEAVVKIRAVALGVGVGVASVEEVDAFNIRMASLLAMRRAVDALGITPQGFLVDGKDVFSMDLRCAAVVDGDAKSLSVAAASIVAKVARDAMMIEQATFHPMYAFESNKGYGTPEHLSALREHGPCAIHRRSFRPVWETLYEQVTLEI